MRYRPASKRPGRNRPSFKSTAAELESLELGNPDGGFGVVRGFAVEAKSIVARSSEVSEVAEDRAAPQDEQNRPFEGAGEPQEAQ
jgi:hypothetical protein